MFNSLIVASDVAAGQDRARGIAASLARRGRLPVEVMTVAPRRAQPDAERRGWMSQQRVGDDVTIVEGDDVAASIVDHVRDRDGALLVMTTAANGLVSLVRRSVAGDVLAELRQPVLLLGPKVPDRVALAASTLVAGCDHSHDSPPALPVIEAWQRTFEGGRPWLVDVIATAAWPAGTIDDVAERAHVDTVAAELAEHGVDAAATVVHGGDPVWALLEFAEAVDDVVFVMTSDRWASGRSHWYSTTRRLVQRSPRPVLVVPGDLPGY